MKKKLETAINFLFIRSRKLVVFFMLLVVIGGVINFLNPVYEKIKIHMFAHEKLHVVFGINNEYVYYTKLAINSIIKNNNSKSDYVFWILNPDISDENKKDMANYAKSIGQHIVFVKIDEKYMEKWNNVLDVWPPITMARILIPDLLPQNVNKAVYLDADILVAEDLKNLFDVDIEGYYAAMVEDCRPEWHQLELLNGKKYANSGVILFNVKKMRQDDIMQKMLKYFDNHLANFLCVENFECYYYKDQDLLNLVLHDGIKFLDNKWNNVSDWNNVNIINQEGIYHFAAQENKPWINTKTDAQKLWAQYKEEAGL